MSEPLIVSIPFTYRICWSSLDKHYYGVRYADGCTPTDLWTTYFTSSQYVDLFRKLNGEPDVVEIRKIFQSKQDAKAWESRVLKRLQAATNSKWLNKTNR